MRYLLGLLFLMVWLVMPTATHAYTSDDFVITVDTSRQGSTANNQYRFLTDALEYNFTVNWGDGSTTTHVGIFTSVIHTYATPGVYTIAITPNEIGGLPTAIFGVNNFYSIDNDDKQKILTVEQWGTNRWESFFTMFNQAENVIIKAQDSPNLSEVSSFDTAFNGVSAIESDISNWDVSNVTNMYLAFNSIDNFDQDLSGWNISNVVNMSAMLPSMSTENYSALLNGWAALPSLQNNVNLGIHAQYSDTAVTARQFLIDTYNWTISDNGQYIEPGNETFITLWDTTMAGDPNELNFYINGGSEYNFNIDWGDGAVQYYNTDNGGTLTHTYATSGIKTVTITGTFKAFAGCDGAELRDVLQWGTGQWEYLIFQGCSGLEDFSAVDTPDTSAIIGMTQMFFQASNFNGEIGDWDTSSVESMQNAFYSATNFNGDISNWNTSNVTSFANMFSEALAFNQDIGGWDTSAVINMSGMFLTEVGRSPFNQDVSDWDISNVTDLEYIFSGSSLSASNYSKILDGWSQQTVQIGLDMGIVGGVYDEIEDTWGDLTPYCASVQSARDILVNTFGWLITDDGAVPCKTATYSVTANGTITGDNFQYIVDGESGTAVTVVPASGYRFTSWSDGSTANPRTDTNLTADITVTAILESTDDNSNKSSGTRIGVRDESLMEKISTVPVIGSIATFVINVKNFLNYLNENEEELEKLTPEERTQVIIALRNIVVFLLTLIPGV